METSSLTQTLRNLAAHNRAAAVLFAEYANRQRNRRVTPKEWMVTLAAGHKIAEHEVIHMFRQLEAADCGRYIEGRKGHASRFVWSRSSLEVSQLATGKLQEATPARIMPVVDEAEEESLNMEPHPFRLRADLTITLDLPSDLTKAEAERLALFVTSLPRE